MDLRRFLDLYVSETNEHVRLLHRSLLQLEGDPASGAVDEAFRAAHTLKGISAAMGFRAVAAVAHTLEDRLDELRAGRIAADARIIDEMLAETDRLEAVIAEAVAAAPDELAAGAPETAPAERTAGGGAGGGFEAGTAGAPVARRGEAPPFGEAPEGTATVAVVRLHPDAPVKSARAMIILRALESLAEVLGSAPASFDDDFSGEFAIYLSPGTDLQRTEAAIAGAGDVQSVQFVEPMRNARPAPSEPAVRPAPARGTAGGTERQVRVDARRLDSIAEGVGELSVLFGRLGPEVLQHPELGDMVGRMHTVLATLQRDVLQLRMVPLRAAFERLPRAVRDAARTLGRDVELVVAGDDVELDRTIVEELGDPLVHLLRNAVDHGVEESAAREAAGKPARGRIQVTAERERSSVRITITDDGAGVAADRVAARAREAGLLAADAPDPDDDELFRLLSHPGLSTAAQVSTVSGRGVGMDIVVSRIRSLGGAIDMTTTAGQGTTFGIRLPVTRAVAQALRVRIAGEEYAIPLTHVSEAVDMDGHVDGSGEQLMVRGVAMPLVRLRSVLQVAGPGHEQTAVIAMRGDRRAALAVDELLGREQILVKEFDAVSGTFPYFSGATLLADGRPALVLDPLSVI